MSDLINELNISKKVLNNILDLFSNPKEKNEKKKNLNSDNLIDKLVKHNKVLIIILNKIQKNLDNKIDIYYKSSPQNINIEYLEKLKNIIEIVQIILESPKLLYKVAKTHKNIKEIIKYF